MKIDVLDHDGGQVFCETCPDGESREIRIGRSADNTIVLPGLQVSPLHAVIRISPKKITIEDAGSINGILLNQVRMVRRVEPLAAGDSLSIADYTIQISGDTSRRSLRSPRRTMLLALLTFMVIFTGVVFVLKKQGNLPDGSTKEESVAVAQPTPPPTPVPTPNLAAVTMEAALKALLAGENAYFRNDIGRAAEQFRLALSLNPSIPRAAEYLKQIDGDYLDRYLKYGYTALNKKDMNTAAVALNMLVSLDPDNEKVMAFKTMIEGQQKMRKARQLVRQGRILEARELLLHAETVNDAGRQNLLAYIDGLSAFNTKYMAVSDAVNRLDFSGALALLRPVLADPSLSPQWIQQLDDDREVIQSLIRFQNVLSENNRYAVVTTGRRILVDLESTSWTGPVAYVKSTFDTCRSSWLPDRTNLQAQTEASLKHIDELVQHRNDDKAGMALRSTVEDLTLLQFLQPTPSREAELKTAQDRLTEYIRNIYQQAYVSQSMGQNENAIRLYQHVLDAALFDSPYVQPARERLALLNADTKGENL